MKLTPLTSQPHNHRILIIDDNPSIHEDFRKILGPADAKLAEELDATEASLFGDHAGSSSAQNFRIDSAFQGQEGLEKVRAACAEGAPYAVAFVDVRMPPGWDGIETISRIWKEFPDLQIVICTAYSDYSWDEIAKSVGNTDKMLVLKKPFDNVEVLQMAHALSKKWQLTQMGRKQMEELDALVNQRTAELRAANARLTGEVAERAAAEEALRRSEERFSKAFHASPVPMAIQRPDGKDCLDANTSFLELVGASREAVLAGSTTFWADESTPTTVREELAARHAVRNLAATIRTTSDERREALVAAEIVEQTVAMLRRLIGEHIALDMQLAPDLPPIFADPNNVEQVIMNLALNARDAMPDGGKLTLTTTRVEVDNASRARNPESQLGPYICLAVKDSGYGMDAATVGRIFEPFFTTKDPGQGTGMGLATVYGVLKQHGGWIEVDTAPGRGTTIRTFFPLSVDGFVAASAKSESSPTESTPTNAITILVVEDDEMVREFVSEALAALGYRVLSAVNGRDALEVWAEHRDEIDLLLTDVVMPESISGRQLAHTLILDKPNLKVIFTSGYSSELFGSEFEREKEHLFLAKPYLPDRLAQTVAMHLQSQDAPAFAAR